MSGRWFALAILLVMGIESAQSADPSPEEFFEKSVRPVLVTKCLECHGEELPEGNLRLTSRAQVLKGGQTGPAAVDRKPDASLLLRAIRQ
jgi:hypothetical protein